MSATITVDGESVAKVKVHAEAEEATPWGCPHAGTASRTGTSHAPAVSAALGLGDLRVAVYDDSETDASDPVDPLPGSIERTYLGTDEPDHDAFVVVYRPGSPRALTVLVHVPYQSAHQLQSGIRAALNTYGLHYEGDVRSLRRAARRAVRARRWHARRQ